MSNPVNGLYEFGPYRLEAAKRILTRDGARVDLAPKTLDLLLLFVESQGRVLTKRELMNALWLDTFVEEASLSYQVATLRKALDEKGDEWIETVPKHGYRFTAPVTPLSSALEIASQPPAIAPAAAQQKTPHHLWPVAARRLLRVGLRIAAALLVALAGAGVHWWFTRPAAFGQLPQGWYPTGSNPRDYDMGVDRRVFHGGGASAFVKSRVVKPQGFGTLLQSFQASEYRGKRLRLSGYVKTDKVENYVGLWLRVDGENDEISMDNMHDRPIKGTTDWKKYEVVADVPDGAAAIFYGLLLRGRGTGWMDDIQFEEVESIVPVTTKLLPPRSRRGRKVEPAPVNVNFEGWLWHAPAGEQSLFR